MKKHINQIYNLVENWGSNDIFILIANLECLAYQKEEEEEKKFK